MSRKIKWGVLSTANIGVRLVIPAMQQGSNLEVNALASRDKNKARKLADQLGIPNVYGSYEELLQAQDIDAIYIPLPNDLHVHWTAQAIKAGKHVLCEKPLALTSQEIAPLLKLRDQYQVKVGEAFMVRCHPQWHYALEAVKQGDLGRVVGYQGFFSYFNDDPNNIRNIKEKGGGALYDIGCYPIFTSRLIFQEEPKRVVSLLEFDPAFKTDRLGSVILDYPSGQATFMISTQAVPYQRVEIIGTKKRLEIKIPFNALNHKPGQVFTYQGDLEETDVAVKTMTTCDQYTLQGEAFSQAILDNSDVPVSLESAVANAKVIEAVMKSTRTKQWVDVS
jgi:predicted dehydrogenase